MYLFTLASVRYEIFNVCFDKLINKIWVDQSTSYTICYVTSKAIEIASHAVKCKFKCLLSYTCFLHSKIRTKMCKVSEMAQIKDNIQERAIS